MCVCDLKNYYIEINNLSIANMTFALKQNNQLQLMQIDMHIINWMLYVKPKSI